MIYCKKRNFAIFIFAFVLGCNLFFVSCNDAKRLRTPEDKIVIEDSSMIDMSNYKIHKVNIGSEITNVPISSQLVEIGGKEKYMLMDRGYIYVFGWETGIKEGSIPTRIAANYKIIQDLHI